MIHETVMPPEQSFWIRQTSGSATAGQIVFDLVFGVGLPVLCLLADPLVFRASSGVLLLGDYALPAYLCIGVQMATLFLWLILRRPHPLFAGILAAGALFALCLGVVLLPFSLIGLLAGIGILGFTPFATAFVYGRNSLRAFAGARQRERNRPLFVAFCAFLLALAAPLAVQFYVRGECDRAIELALSAEPSERSEGVRRLRRFGPAADLDRLVYIYAEETEERRQQQIREVYKELTDGDIDHRLLILRD